MPRNSSGLIMYRRADDRVEVLLVHPGGPFWKNKDLGAWSIPKGEAAEGENLLACAKREFEEETGFKPSGDFFELRPIKQKSGKIVHAWAFEGDCDPTTIVSNTVFIEWPPRSGKRIEVPEVDHAEFFDIATAKQKINPAQAALLDELVQQLEKR
jgi:predicted NUDIX family NTP pyrophosphohydrolase